MKIVPGEPLRQGS